MKFEIIKADLIQEALGGMFDVIAHGCNCFCVQGAGIAAQMAKIFFTLKMPLENIVQKGDWHKLGNIEWHSITDKGDWLRISNPNDMYANDVLVTVINAYTQYEPGKNLDYEALTLCMRKINHEFKGKDIGLPWIGCGIAGGDKVRVEQILRQELKDCNVTICEL